jgi:hypothetical protein
VLLCHHFTKYLLNCIEFLLVVVMLVVVLVVAVAVAVAAEAAAAVVLAVAVAVIIHIFIQSICNYILATQYVFSCSAVTIYGMLLPMLNVLYSYISTFRSTVQCPLWLFLFV